MQSPTSKYPGWERIHIGQYSRPSLAEDVDFAGPVDDIPLFALQYQLGVHVQNKMCMGIMTTNRGHHTRKGVLVVGDWTVTNETYF
jgi:hypothetical protein